jgi:transcription antitermination factor NusG
MAESQTKDKEKETQEEFDARREQERSAQALADPNAVPEHRPQASQIPNTMSEREKEKAEEEPLGKEDYEAAESDSQLKKAEKEETEHGPEHLRDGDKVYIIDGEYEGAVGVVVDVTWENLEEQTKARSGDPAVARFAKASEYLVRTRGQQHLVSVTPEEVEQYEGELGPNVSEL